MDFDMLISIAYLILIISLVVVIIKIYFHVKELYQSSTKLVLDVRTAGAEVGKVLKPLLDEETLKSASREILKEFGKGVSEGVAKGLIEISQKKISDNKPKD